MKRIFIFTSTALIFAGMSFILEKVVLQMVIEPRMFIPEVTGVIPPFMNPGIAFGISLPWLMQILLTLGILIALTVFIFQLKTPIVQTVLCGIIAGGGLYNFASRLLAGGVLDYLVLNPIPVFNLADVGITLGAFGFLLVELLKRPKK